MRAEELHKARAAEITAIDGIKHCLICTGYRGIKRKLCFHYRQCSCGKFFFVHQRKAKQKYCGSKCGDKLKITHNLTNQNNPDRDIMAAAMQQFRRQINIPTGFEMQYSKEVATAMLFSKKIERRFYAYRNKQEGS